MKGYFLSFMFITCTTALGFVHRKITHLRLMNDMIVEYEVAIVASSPSTNLNILDVRL
jgi:hypothetical protein